MTKIESTPPEMGGNLTASELSVGREARDCLKTYDKLMNRLGKTVAQIHDVILTFGQKLREGQSMYPGTKDFGAWVERHGLNKGPLGSQQERTASMTLARLVIDGAEIEEGDDEDVVPVKATLEGCNLTTPTNIMKWLRKTQPHLFPNLRTRTKETFASREARRRESEANRAHGKEEADAATNFLEQQVTRLRARVRDLEDEVAELEAENARLRGEQG